MSTRTRVAVVGGGANSEHEISLASAAGVAAALDVGRYDVVRLTIDPDGDWCDEDHERLALPSAVRTLQACDVVIPVLHGPHGEDGTLAALCDLAGVPYVGSGLGAGALAMDKWATKLVARSLGIAVAPEVLLTPATVPAYTFSHPVVVKPVTAGSSHGVTLVRGAAELPAALVAALALDPRVLVEDVVLGREIDLAVLGRPDGARVVAPALEIVADGVFDTESKYGGGADFRVPALLTDDEHEALVGAAKTMYDALGCAGVARIDFFLTDGGPVLNEVNTMPGLTEESQVPKMFAAAGVSYPELVDMLVRDAVVGFRHGVQASRRVVARR
ncbi:MAG TPA: D-alanine--D-alanine ligase [Nocardioides sp.]|uniref:D-alanine--D-alanine ligase family protein n=1 Tax=Nocardioides sp. TaxID=35761 RepID=UPI002E3310C7|nr:D-alanine--D-alanine ligase [Nocardioides sp.]HEX3930417.1 D-alanine--D-alanine ligase [Nocardioides sp.]